MSSSIAMKPNPFQRSNPFQVQSTYQTSVSTSFSGYQVKPSFRPAYETQSLMQKQNSFSKKIQPQVWKFREDNCAKSRVFNHHSGAILHEKYLQDKNSFQKQLVLSSVGRRNHNGTSGHNINHNSGQQAIVERGHMENPFARKYLVSANPLAESHVYTGFTGGVVGQQNLPTYERYKTQKEIYTPQPEPINTYSYSNYIPPAPVQDNYMAQLITQIGSNSHLETSLHQKSNQYASRKSIERGDSLNRNGSYNNINAVESRYLLERENRNQYNSVGSSKDLQMPYSKDSSYPVNPSKSIIPLAERDRESAVHSRMSVKEENVRFEHSDSDEQRDRSKQKHRQPTFGSKNQLSTLPGPQQITINGMKFYRQNLLCY